jgi:hypothetical protein
VVASLLEHRLVLLEHQELVDELAHAFIAAGVTAIAAFLYRRR